MPTERDIRSDLFALGLLVLVAFMGLALATYDPADPTMQLVAPFDKIYRADQIVFPHNAQVINACGPWGALMASLLLDSVGLGAYFGLLSLGTVTGLLLMRREIDLDHYLFGGTAKEKLPTKTEREKATKRLSEEIQEIFYGRRSDSQTSS